MMMNESQETTGVSNQMKPMRNKPTSPGLAPVDLRESISEPILIQLALNSVQTLDWSSAELKAQETDEFRPQMMMTLLTYCYAAGLFGSWDIEWAIQNNRTARYICAHSYPDSKAIQAFRRRNRAFLHQTLTGLLQQAWAWRLDQGDEDYPGYAWVEAVLTSRLDASARNRLEVAAIMDEIHFEG